MEIHILGAHLSEVRGARLSSLLIDGTLAIDAGCITSALSLPEQERIRAVLLTHHHFDHTRDLITLTANAGYYWQRQLVVHGLQHTLDVIKAYLFDGTMYMNFLQYPTMERPSLVLETIEPRETYIIAGYTVKAVPVKHSVPSVGYQITSPDSKSVFYTGDATVGLSDCWQHVSPQLIITEVTGPNRHQDWLKKVGHLCAAFLKEELAEFRRLKQYLPSVIVTHIGNPYEEEIREEVAQIARDLETDLVVGHEDMKVKL